MLERGWFPCREPQRSAEEGADGNREEGNQRAEHVTSLLQRRHTLGMGNDYKLIVIVCICLSHTKTSFQRFRRQ
jgi:hypothetical protein